MATRQAEAAAFVVTVSNETVPPERFRRSLIQRVPLLAFVGAIAWFEFG